MLFFISYKSLFYADVKSSIITDWDFLLILHVPRLLFNQCFTVLFNEIECYSNQKCQKKIRIDVQIVLICR